MRDRGCPGIKTYLALRKQYGIRQAVEVPALETMVGTRVMELKGKIKGTFQVGNRFSLLVERTDGATETVDSDAIPEWLSGGNDIPARLIIKASRAEAGTPLHAILIAVSPEDQIAPIEQAEQEKPAKPPPRRRSNLKEATCLSRSRASRRIGTCLPARPRRTMPPLSRRKIPS